MKHTLLWLFLALSLCSLADNPALTIHYDGGNGEPASPETGKIAELPDPQGAALLKTAPESAAAAVALKKIRYTWTPTIDTSRPAGVAALADAALSPDQSLLVLLERTGNPPGPYGSRLIFVNTANGIVLRAFSLPGAKKCSRLLFSGRSLLLLENAQQDNGIDALYSFSLRPFEFAAEPLHRFEQPISDIAPGQGGAVYAKERDCARMLILNGPAAKACPTRSPGGKLVSSHGGKVVFNLLPGGVERYRLLAGELLFDKQVPFAGTPDFALPIGEWLLAGCAGGKALLHFLNDDAKAPLALSADSGGAAVWDEKNGQLIMTLEKNRTIGFFRLPDSPKPVSLLKANGMHPKTRGEILFLYRLNTPHFGLLAVDENANMIRFEEGRKKRIYKDILLSPAEK